MKTVYSRWQGLSVVGKVGITACGILLLVFAGYFAWLIRGFDECAQTFVSNRPDLTTHGDIEEWAKVHAADFIPVEKAHNLNISITQGCLAPAPDSLVARFSMSPQDLKAYLKGKTLRQETVESIVATERLSGVDYYGYPHNKLSWWPPRQETTLKVYEGRSAYSERYYVFLETTTNTVTVISAANRGR